MARPGCSLSSGFSAQDLLRELVQRSVPLEHFEIATPTLDEIFIQIVQGEGAPEMMKFWRVFAYEYLRHVKRKRFIFAVISLPLFLVLIMVVSIFSVTMGMDHRPLGLCRSLGRAGVAAGGGGAGKHVLGHRTGALR
jgi:hypothetical protein